MSRMSRAQMCQWLSSELVNIRTEPTNPADTHRYVELAKAAKRTLTDLAEIADELGTHVDASLDHARELIAEYMSFKDFRDDLAEATSRNRSKS